MQDLLHILVKLQIKQYVFQKLQCTCGCKTVERENISRDLVSLEVIVHTTQYVGKKTYCPQSKQAECNFHILRYCKGEYEIHHRECIKDFMNYLLSLRDNVEEYKSVGKTSFTLAEYEEAKKKYLELLDIWYKEFKNDYDSSHSINRKLFFSI